MSRHLVARLWRARYHRAVASAFRTVPLYRELWALDGRSDPVLVAGRTGRAGGAITTDEALYRLTDLVPLAGGRSHLDSARGLRPVLGGSAVYLDPRRPGAELAAALPPGRAVVAGYDKQLAELSAGVSAGALARLRTVPCRTLDELAGARDGVLHDDVLGFLGVSGRCGRWHLDWPRVYARATPAGLAFTLLRQPSPRLVDVLPGGGVPGVLRPCPRHGTPTVLT